MKLQTLEGECANLVRYLDGMLIEDRKVEMAKSAQSCLMSLLTLVLFMVSVGVLSSIRDSVGELPGIVNFFLLAFMMFAGMIASIKLFGPLMDPPKGDVDETKIKLARHVLEGMPNQACSFTLGLEPSYFGAAPSGKTWLTLTGNVWGDAFGGLSVASQIEVRTVRVDGHADGSRVHRTDIITVSMPGSLKAEAVNAILPAELALVGFDSDEATTTLKIQGAAQTYRRKNGSYSVFVSAKEPAETVLSVIRAVSQVAQ